MLPPAGACIDCEWAVAPAGRGAKPLRSPRCITAFPSRSFSALGAPGPGARDPALGHALRALQRHSQPGQRAARGVSPTGPARRCGWRLTGRKPTQILRDEHSWGHGQTPRARTGRGPGYLVSGSRGAASPQQPRAQSGLGEAEREPGSRAAGQLFTHAPTRCALRSRRRGAGDCCEAPARVREGRVSSGIGSCGLRVPVPERPSLPSPPRGATRAAPPRCVGRGRRGLGCPRSYQPPGKLVWDAGACGCARGEGRAPLHQTRKLRHTAWGVGVGGVKYPAGATDPSPLASSFRPKSRNVAQSAQDGDPGFHSDAWRHWPVPPAV